MAMWMQEYAVHADHAHIREYADADENLIHINYIEILTKNCHLLGKICVKNGSKFVPGIFF